MQHFLILLALIFFLLVQTTPAFCASGARVVSLVVSATLPEHIMMYRNSQVASFSNNPAQVVQTQTVIRNNKSVSLTSIVVP